MDVEQNRILKIQNFYQIFLTEVGLPVTKQVQDVCLKLSPSDELVAVIHKTIARHVSLKILARMLVWTLPEEAHNGLPRSLKEFTRDGADMNLMLKRCLQWSPKMNR